VAIGVFLWFPPLFRMKTVGAILSGVADRSNILAAVIAVPFMISFGPSCCDLPLEYCLGYWLLSLRIMAGAPVAGDFCCTVIGATAFVLEDVSPASASLCWESC